MKNLIEITNEVQILDGQIKQGDFIMVYDKNQWAKKKFYLLKKHFGERIAILCILNMAAEQQLEKFLKMK